MLATEMLLAMRHSILDNAATPAIAAASATGRTGKRNRVIPELAPMTMLLASQTRIAVRHNEVFRTASTIKGAKIKHNGPKNCQNPKCSGSIEARKGNFASCQIPVWPLAPVSASNDVSV